MAVRSAARQALQAFACRVPPTVDMNPVLIKPQSDTGAQLIVRGGASRRMHASTSREIEGELLQVALDSFHPTPA